MKKDIINIVDNAKSYINSYSKKNNYSDNKVVKYILEELFESEFIIANNEKILYSSSKYSNMIEKEVSNELKNMINNTNGFRRHYLKIATRKYFEGFVFGIECSKKNNNKTFLVINCNLNKISHEVLPIIENLKEYIYLY